ncbi:F-box domain-containing protein [Mycena venus]|uniref:F-box domain-containing protein n=1 Tax=Mycena venus TaxID=2733690 RepID=A0A8H6X566_9AGAR|nr:F-box domain-containing protein [Mycena venus]
MLNALAAERARIAELEARILDPDLTFYDKNAKKLWKRALQIEIALAQERLDSYKYPVLTLPNEIVSEIFVHFLPAYPICPPLIGLLSPTTLTHICRRWREIALATPALWRAINLSGNDAPGPRYGPGFIAISVAPSFRRGRVLDMISRSRSCSLSIRMDEWDNTSKEVETAAELLRAVIPSVARWEYLTLYLDETHLPPFPAPMPLLCQLELWLGDGSPTARAAKVELPEMPLLRTVILNDAVAARNVNLPWE